MLVHSMSFGSAGRNHWLQRRGAKIDRSTTASCSMVFQSHATMDLPRVRAPEFPEGLDWIGTDGRALTLADLRGKVAILDFWTYG
jgi:hypothetical protein